MYLQEPLRPIKSIVVEPQSPHINIWINHKSRRRKNGHRGKPLPFTRKKITGQRLKSKNDLI